VLKEALSRLAGVQAVSVASGVPGGHLDGHGVKLVGAEEYSGLNVLAVDLEYQAVMGLEIASGRWYEAASTADANGFVINEAAVAYLGLDAPLDTQLDHNGDIGPILGVVQDFHFSSLHEAILPLILYQGSNWWDRRRLVLKLDGPNLAGTLDALQATWAQIIPENPFEYTFLDDDLDRLYAAEQRVGRIFGTFAFLGIFVACLGLFGLAAFTTAQRTKEIGVRKVLGASVSSIVTQLTRQFVKLVAVAFLIAAPLAYFLMNRWLDDFAYRIEISWPIFLTAGLAALGVALLTVSYQAVTAALADPVKSLRYE
jgi:putative ABC transport system permease protein